MALQLLPHVPGYEIREQLHRGGQGIIYRALQIATGRQVVVKVIRPELLSDARAVQRFRLEGRAAARLQHPNIVTLFDMGQEGGVHFLIMEFIDGLDLRSWVQRFGPMPAALACDCLRQAALGLQHACARGLIHRDLKPSNLIRRSEDGAVKVLDLGLARLCLPTENETLTSTGSLLGTVDFMAPEQIENPSQVDIRADLYSLGGTLYYLLSGRVPFPEESLTRKLDGHRWHWPTPLERLRADVPAAVVSLCRRLLAKHPDDRFASPAELADALTTVIAGLELPPPAAEYLEKRAASVPATASASPWLQLPPGYVGECRCFRGHAAYVVCVALVPDDRKLLSGGLDGEMRLWDIETGALQHVFQGHESSVWRLHVTADGDHCISGGADRTIRTWDLRSGQQLACVPLAIVAEIDNLAISPDGKHVLVCGSDGVLHLCDPQSGQRLCCLEQDTDDGKFTFHGVAFSPDGRYAATGSRDGTVRLWDIANGRPVARLTGHAGPVFDLAFSSAGCLASAGHDQSVRLWDVARQSEIGRLAGHQSTVRCATFTATGKHLLSAGNDQTVRLWDAAACAEICRLQGHTDHVNCVALSHDGQFAATGANDSTVRLWQLPGLITAR